MTNLVDDVLAMCPASMGTGLLVDDTDNGRRQRVQAVARIKELLEQVKANIKVCWCWWRCVDSLVADLVASILWFAYCRRVL